MWLWPLLTLAALGPAPLVLAACQLIAVDLCRGAGYNYTSMPNLVGHETQADAEFTLQTFSPLVQYGCSAQLGFFLCSVYIPMCNEKVASPIGPCRGLCESVRARCYPVLQGFGFPWPAALDCAKFPAQNDHLHMCMEGPGEAGLGVLAARPAAGPKPYPRAMDGDTDPCSHLARPAMYVRTNRSGRCLQRCDADVLFTRADKLDAEVWLAVLSVMCFVSSVLAATTLLTGEPLPVPERPLALVALGHAMVAAGWGLRAALGRDAVACYPAPSHPASLLLAQAGLGNAHCALIFFLTYYFGNAISVWWLVLLSCWLLRWSHPSLPHAPLVHLLGWGLPACLTIAVLILRHVDADELTGVCSVGNHNPHSLLALVIVPQFVYLVLGVSLMTLCVFSQAGSWPSHRVVLSVLYVVPSCVSLATHWYQYWGHEGWVLAMAPSPWPRRQPHPLLWVYLTRCLLSLATGTAVSLWVCLPHSPRACWPQPPVHNKPVKGYYYYPQHDVHRPQVHRSHRKHKGKNGNETLV